MKKIKVEISPADFLDRLSILNIKLENFENPEKKATVRKAKASLFEKFHIPKPVLGSCFVFASLCAKIAGKIVISAPKESPVAKQMIEKAITSPAFKL